MPHCEAPSGSERSSSPAQMYRSYEDQIVKVGLCYLLEARRVSLQCSLSSLFPCSFLNFRYCVLVFTYGLLFSRAVGGRCLFLAAALRFPGFPIRSSGQNRYEVACMLLSWTFPVLNTNDFPQITQSKPSRSAVMLTRTGPLQKLLIRPRTVSVSLSRVN